MELNKQFFSKNRNKLHQLLDEGQVIILSSPKPPHKSADASYHEHFNRNFYYFTGIRQVDSYYIAYKIHGEVYQKLFILPFNPTYEKWYGKLLSVELAREISGIEQVQVSVDFIKELNFLAHLDINQLYLDFSPYNIGNGYTNKLSDSIKQMMPYLNIGNCHFKLAKLRLIKEKEEIEVIKQAIEMTGGALKYTLSRIESGQKEYQMKANFEYYLANNNAELAFPSIIATGVNAVCLHYEKGESESRDGDLVLFDVGAQNQGYASDISRTYPVNGKFSSRQKEIYSIVLNIQKEIIAYLKPGIKLSESNKYCKELVFKYLSDINLIKDFSEVSNYYYHSVSHHLGLDTHDVSIGDIPLQEGMIITVEPGIYIKEEGIGIRIEDDVLITKDGSQVLSINIVKEIEEIEELMEGK